MQSPPTNGMPSFTYAPLSSSSEIVKRASILRALCVFELIFAPLGGLFVHFMFFCLIPIDIIGLLAARRMNITMMSAFAFLKLLSLAIFGLLFLDVVSSKYGVGSEPMFMLLMAAVLLYQISSIFTAVKLRRDIILAQHMNESTVELNSISDAQAHQMSQMPQMPQMPQMSHMPYMAQMPQMSHTSQMPHMSQMPQMPQMSSPPFPHDPHATAGVPGYPYPPHSQQYYPAMYMNQGYPAPYPMMMAHPSAGSPQPLPVSPYPSFTIDEETPQPTTTN